MSTINIDSKGYGTIYKAVMRNRQLPLLAEAIYAYLCTYADSGFQAYAKRDADSLALKIQSRGADIVKIISRCEAEAQAL